MTEPKSLLPIMTINEIMAEVDRRQALPITDPDNPDGFEWDEAAKGWCIWWGKYEYFVEHSRLTTPERLLGWLVHIGAKGWEHSTPERMANWVEAVAIMNGWKIHT